MVRILLDVDGVILPVFGGEFPDCWSEWRRVGRDAWAPPVIRGLRDLVERGAEIRWLTTWEQQANSLCEMLDFPECELAAPRDHAWEVRHPEDWWKLKAAQELWAEDPVPFVWIDDDLKYDEPAVAWLKSLRPYAIGVSPDWRFGLTPTLMAAVDGFVDRWAGISAEAVRIVTSSCEVHDSLGER